MRDRGGGSCREQRFQPRIELNVRNPPYKTRPIETYGALNLLRLGQPCPETDLGDFLASVEGEDLAERHCYM